MRTIVDGDQAQFLLANLTGGMSPVYWHESVFEYLGGSQMKVSNKKGAKNLSIRKRNTDH